MHPVERTHLDGLMVTSTSPEAMEEVVWLAFFPETHNPEVSQLLNGNTNNSNFETFYISHIKKLLLSRAAQRYVSKGNYNLTRLPYLLKLFPSARFIIPVRRPLTHVASLMKQQRLFATGEGKHPRALEHMRRLGHFEFGLDRRAINVGDSKVAREVRELWQRGEEPRGWARYWASIYGWLADRLDHDQLLREAAAVVRFEDLCNRPQETLSRVLVHTGLANPDLVSEFANRVQAPTYYRPSFSAEEASVILQETGRVAERYGYIGSEIAVPSGPVG
jgi:hypothetical protein